MFLFAEGDADDGAYERLENEVEAQEDLFQCAPMVVGVIVAAVAEGSIPAANLATSLDVLGRIVAGHADRSEIALGNGDLREQCHAEAMKGTGLCSGWLLSGTRSTPGRLHEQYWWS